MGTGVTVLLVLGGRRGRGRREKRGDMEEGKGNRKEDSLVPRPYPKHLQTCPYVLRQHIM